MAKLNSTAATARVDLRSALREAGEKIHSCRQRESDLFNGRRPRIRKRLAVNYEGHEAGGCGANDLGGKIEARQRIAPRGNLGSAGRFALPLHQHANQALIGARKVDGNGVEIG